MLQIQTHKWPMAAYQLLDFTSWDAAMRLGRVVAPHFLLVAADVLQHRLQSHWQSTVGLYWWHPATMMNRSAQATWWLPASPLMTSKKADGWAFPTQTFTIFPVSLKLLILLMVLNWTAHRPVCRTLLSWQFDIFTKHPTRMLDTKWYKPIYSSTGAP